MARLAPPGDRTYGQWWDWHGDYAEVPIDDLRAVGYAAYEAAGASADDARFLFDGELDKTLQGDHARGVVYFPNNIRLARAGTLDLAAEIVVVREKAATAIVSGGARAVGRLVCKHGMELAIDKAREHGVGLVGAEGGAGLLTQYVALAVDAGMVGVVVSQTGPAVAPLGGFEPLLGNGPFAIGVPGRDADPVILDMSFTQTSASGVLLAAQQGEHIPEGLILDSRGDPTTDAAAFAPVDPDKRTGREETRGTLAPLGGHKGYAMLFALGLLASLLSDTSPPWELGASVSPTGRTGSVMIAIDVEALNPDAPARVDAFIDRVTGAPRRAGVGEILYPGQRSQQLRRERRTAGTVAVPVPDLEALCTVADAVGVAVPDTLRP
jgi:L-2-hydroxycarboxylate dehydrogenase (NAD+)